METEEALVLLYVRMCVCVFVCTPVSPRCIQIASNQVSNLDYNECTKEKLLEAEYHF